MLDIQHIEQEKEGKFVYSENNEVLAKITYKLRNENEMAVDHTNVDPSLGGKGVGKQLVIKVVEFARANNYKIIPICPFVKALIDKTPEWQDLI